MYDGIIIGWSAYTLIQGRTRRVGLLKVLKRQMVDDAPLLLSFFVRPADDHGFRIIERTANMMRTALLRPDRVERGNDLVYNFVHCFLPSELDEELREGGFLPVEMVRSGTSGYAVGRAVPLCDETHKRNEHKEAGVLNESSMPEPSWRS